MPPKDQHLETQSLNSEAGVSLKRVERFLRLLTWQLFFLLALLLYLAVRPQAGRYQFLVGRDGVMVFDTAWSQIVQIKLQKREVPSSGKPESGPPPAAGEGK
jgi:hypothetical protein